MSEKEMTLGEFLRSEREKHGITIEQVASATKVGVRTLHALEADHYVELPARPYIRGFVTSYCRFIGLDPKEIRARFDDYISKKAVERPNRDGGHSGYAFEKKDGEQQSRTILLIAICSFVLVGGVAVIVLKPSLKHHRSSHIDKLRAAHRDDTDSKNLTPGSEPSVSPMPIAMPSPTIVVSEVAKKEPEIEAVKEMTNESEDTPTDTSPSSIPTSSADPLDSGLSLPSAEIHHKVIIRALADIWVRYQVDNRQIRKFIIRKGKVLVLRAKDKAILQVSNPNSVLYSYNGKSSQLFGISKNVKKISGVATLEFASHDSGDLEDLFQNESDLPKTADPLVDTTSQIHH